jgi:hypothetical protein
MTVCTVTVVWRIALQYADGDSPWGIGGIPVANAGGVYRGRRIAYTHPRSLQASATRATATR